MVSHGPSDCEFGTTRFMEDEYKDATAVPIHFALSPGEYFTSAWRYFTFTGSRWDVLFVVRFVPDPRTKSHPVTNKCFENTVRHKPWPIPTFWIIRLTSVRSGQPGR